MTYRRIMSITGTFLPYLEIGVRNVDIFRLCSLIGFMDFSASSFRAARALINKEQEHVASAAGVGRRVIMRLERSGYPVPTEAAHRVRLYYDREGLNFLEPTAELGPGVRWRDRGREDIFNRRQIHAGRVIVNLRQLDFAEKLKVTRSVVSKFETDFARRPTPDFLALAIRVLEQEGVFFLRDGDDGKGFGVRLSKPNQREETASA